MFKVYVQGLKFKVYSLEFKVLGFDFDIGFKIKILGLV
jgi:hypothetical protein